jgi:hypothetical protein
MNRPDDSDTVQMQDEINEEWVKLWRKAATKSTVQTDEITFTVSLLKKAQLKH